ncbi:helix-turn-helix MerR-family like proteins [Candidatus Termititenax aidoneus]|uniref:Helix-turn-helix MerR-family like proteins n=1 Tax=Termititenax aidoneus TaxID=2218524 RepID=A0A388TAT4_TERA1|nr:helix-turn-helix MerR-family like proteins [Candidatus Termititenax aidoneus]
MLALAEKSLLYWQPQKLKVVLLGFECRGEKRGVRLMKPSQNKESLLKAGELAKLTGMLVSTIRFYTKLGLLSADGYTPGKYNLYAKDKALKRLRQIEEFKQRRFTLEEILEKLSARASA